jgi:inosine-uridine nucleoside N-ribohydrolase
LLGWPDVEVVGITTNLDAEGGRAGCVEQFLKLVGREDIPVVAGAAVSMTTLERFESTWSDRRYWPEQVHARPARHGEAMELLQSSIHQGATVVAIGALTNLALLEVSRPGSLAEARVVATAGWQDALGPGWPAWGPEMDFNVQCDTHAADIVTQSADVTLVPPTLSIHAQLRVAHLPRLRQAGALGQLLAAQSEAYAADTGKAELGRLHAALPDDLVNFLWDPVTAAVAVGWPPRDLDVDAFTDAWLSSVEAATRSARGRS